MVVLVAEEALVVGWRHLGESLGRQRDSGFEPQLTI